MSCSCAAPGGELCFCEQRPAQSARFQAHFVQQLRERTRELPAVEGGDPVRFWTCGASLVVRDTGLDGPSDALRVVVGSDVGATDSPEQPCIPALFSDHPENGFAGR